ncbi:TPA: glycerol-3-phosphate transporter [Klebsiella pneumoniae]|nr:glycerol-3-phosphate transporter [Klebsiella pneumoniae]HBU3218886.1 glycerol-3-phosphate transporter [Klebsiella pneumoniae]HBU3223145.1 glycerol-3-phosphate transporter [Klebsiella pneumoniae]
MLSIFKPAAHKARLPAAEIDPLYRRLRWQIFIGIFFGYAAYYLVRKNFALAMPYLIEQGFSRGDLGFALSGISIAYGFSKFIMGSVSDRSNPRIFLPAGLILAALVMLVMGFVPWATSSIMIMFVLLFLCGWFQGMGWPPCGRTMVHWWSQKERGGIVSVWNCAHNVGGGIPPLLFLLGMAWFNDWHAALYMPAFGAILLAIFAFAMMRDTPQSCGLPPIEEYKNDYPDDYSEKHEEELTAKQIFMQYILPNKLLWYIAIANVFVYLLRYGILDWSPTYLKEVKHFALDKSSWAYFLYEYAGIPGTLLCGWMSDKVFPGTYVRPHRHPHTFELLLPLRGRFVVLNFDDRGTVTHRAILGETCTVLEMAAGTWHAVLSLDTGGIIFEVKHGGYQPVAADDYAHWAPAEGEPGTTELMAWYAQAQVGDSTFAV